MRRTSIVISLIIIVVAALLIFPSIIFVRTEQAVVIRRLGVLSHTLEPGPRFAFWLIDNQIRYDLRVREADLDFSAHSTDAQAVRGQVSIQYQLIPTAVLDVAEHFGAIDRLETRLHAVLLQETQNVFATKSAMELVQERATLPLEIRTRLDSVAPQFHVQITNVALEGMSFSPAFEQSIEQVAIADQALRQSELDAARDMVYAQRALEVSRLEAEAILVQVRADAEALAIMQDAWGDLGAEVREIMLRQLTIERWDGSLPEVIGGSDMGFIINGIME
jgi:regulator of protease activity HflC (stomatin/prohibitin superfamily)